MVVEVTSEKYAALLAWLKRTNDYRDVSKRDEIKHDLPLLYRREVDRIREDRKLEEELKEVWE